MLTKVICQCGFPLFNEHVRLGDKYEVDLAITVPNSSVRCGGCGMDIPSTFTFIWVFYKEVSMGGYLPIEAFDL